MIERAEILLVADDNRRAVIEGHLEHRWAASHCTHSLDAVAHLGRSEFAAAVVAGKRFREPEVLATVQVLTRHGVPAIVVCDELQPDDVAPLLAECRSVEMLDVSTLTPWLLSRSLDGIRERFALEVRGRRAHADAVSVTKEMGVSRRSEAMRRMTSGAAHNFNNVLTTVAIAAQMLEDDFEENDPRRLDVVEICSAAERGCRLAAQLLADERRSCGSIGDVEDTVRSVVGMLGPRVESGVEILFDLQHDPAMRVDVTVLEQIVMNLIINALDSMGAKGRLTLRSDRRADELLLWVHDTGQGIAPEHIEKIFEPFFTTKAPDKGTGLGLATCRRLAERAGGALEAESVQGQGATFSVRLPSASSSDDASESTAPTRALLVEPCESLAAVLASLLEAEGIETTRMTTAKQACAATSLDRCQLLIAEEFLPDGSGLELWRSLCESNPTMQLILAGSGHCSSSPAAGVRHEFLEKPFDRNAVMTVLARVRAQ